MQKIKIEYARFRTNGFLLDLVVKGLEVFQVEDKLQKTYQRFVKEDEISAQEYHDTLNVLIEDILCEFFDKTDDKEFEYFESIIKEFLSHYNKIKLEYETLATSQKQLDFILIITFLMPFINILNSFTTFDKSILELILPDEKNTSIQKLFILLEKEFNNKNISIKNELFEILDDGKIENYDAIRKDINNWINEGKSPKNHHIKLISKLSDYSMMFSKRELENYFKIAKVVQFFYEKALMYFGKELTSLLIENHIFFKKLIFMFQKSSMDKDLFEKNLISLYKEIDSKYIFTYLNRFFFHNFFLFDYLSEKSLKKDFYLENEALEIVKFIRQNREYEESFYHLNEKDFFSIVDIIIPMKYFKNKILLESDKPLPMPDIRFKDYSFPLAELFKDTYINNPKTEEIETKVIEGFKKFKNTYDIEEDAQYSFLKARYHAQKREYKQSSEYYIKALKFGKNCMGYHIQAVIKEGLFVSAQDTRKDQLDLKNAKSAFTKFYKEAYFYKLIDNLPDENGFNLYFLNDMKKRADLYFKNLFPHIDKKPKDKEIYKNLGIGLDSDFDKIKIDFNKPNKLIKQYYKNPVPQIIHCINKEDFKSVKRLIDNGADVNNIRPYDNYTALIACVEQGVISEEKLKIVKYLIPQMSKNTINQLLVKKRESALSYSIGKGLIEIVTLLIENGASLDIKATLDEVTPLYQCLSNINFSKNGLAYKNNSKFKVDDPLKIETERKKLLDNFQHFGSNILSDYEKNIVYDKTINDLEVKKFKEAIEAYMPEFITGITKDTDKLYKIFDLILNATTKVDVPHKYGITPLKFATELNEIDLVKKLLDRGANIDYYDDNGYRAYDCAVLNNNVELMELLE